MAHRGGLGAVLSIYGLGFLLVYIPFKLLSSFILYLYSDTTSSEETQTLTPDFVNNENSRNDDTETAPLITRSGILII